MPIRCPSLLCRVLLSLLFCCLLSPVTCFLSFAADTAVASTARFDVPAGPAAATLKQFGQQAKLEILFATGPVGGVTTNAVQGELAAREALSRMLAGTGLTFKQDAGTGGFVVRKETSDEKNGVSPAVAKIAADGPVLKMQEIEVTGSRIRTLLGEATPTPVITYTHQDFELMGVQSFADIARYIPQLSVAGENVEYAPNGLSNATGFVAAGGRTTFNDIRGLGGSNTLILVDGRRLPRVGTRNGGDSYDLNGIPLSAIERLEILPAGDSAIYGSDAVSGVINIILKKNRVGSELRFSYKNTFDSDTAMKTVTFNTGFARKGLSLQLNAEWRSTNSMAPRDRWWTASLDRRPFGGADNRSLVPDGPGVVRSTTTANLPGLNSTVATIPANSDGRNLTVADFANSGPIPGPTDAAKYTDYGHSRDKKIRLTAEYEWRPWLKLRAEVAANEKFTFRPGNYSLPVVGPTKAGSGTDAPSTNVSFAFGGNLVLPAGYPGNPFGVPIIVEKVFWDVVPLLDQRERNTNPVVEIGAQGLLPRAWAYETYIRKSWSNYTSSNSPSLSLPLLAAGVADPDPAKRPILLNNSLRSSPNSADLLRTYLTFRPTTETPVEWAYAAKADGPVWTLPSGAIKAALSAELREMYTDYKYYVVGDSQAAISLNRPFYRRVTETAAEVRVPLLGEKWRLPLLHALSVNGAIRNTNDTGAGGASVPSYGLSWQPAQWVTLRASHSESYKVPLLNSLYGVVQSGTNNFASLAPLITTYRVFDSQRGGEPILRNVGFISGANPDLKAESGRTRSASLDLSVPFVKGLRFSANYSDTKSNDRIVSGSSYIQAIMDYFPERLTRGDKLPTDPASWPGQITFMNLRNLNLSFFRSVTIDFRVQYRRQFGGWGLVNFAADSVKPLQNYEIVIPNTPKTDYLYGRASRSSLRLDWERGPVGGGVAMLYTAKQYGSNPSVSVGVETIPSITQFDFRASYDFGKAKWQPDGWKKYLFRDVQLAARVYNAFPKNPTFRAVNGIVLGNNNSFLRQYQIDLRKNF